MNTEERDTMIAIGKAVTEHGKAIERIEKMLSETPSKPVESPFVPNKVSVVDHEGTKSRFKMEIKFGEELANLNQQERMDHSIKLLTEMELLMRDFGVVNLTGSYNKYENI